MSDFTISSPIDFFYRSLESGKKLCLLPISRIHAEYPVWLAEDLIFFPPSSVESQSLRVVWEPRSELEKFFQNNHAKHQGFAHAERTDLHWVKSAATAISTEDFLNSGLLAFPMTMNWDSLLSPTSHEAHLDLIREAAAHAEIQLNMLRFDYCRVDLPDTLPGRAGFLSEKGFSAALFYTLEDNESYIIGGDVARCHFVTGLGLQIDGVSIRQLSKGDVGYIARHAVQMHTDALEAPNDTAMFINLINLLDYLAEPSDFISMKDAKGRIARHVAKSRGEYDGIIEYFKFLTSKQENGRNIGLRHNIIHIGQRLEQMLDAPGRKEVLNTMNRYAAVVIEDLIRLSSGSWSDVEELRDTFGKALGLTK